MDNIMDRVKLPEIPKGVLKIPYSEWYINIKNPPQENDHDYDIFWEKQERLCKEGCVTGGVFFNPYLYWHLNFWKTEVDYLDDNGKPQQSYINPNFRDNEWMIFNTIWEAEKQQKGLAVGGIRRAAKDLLNSSKLYVFDEETKQPYVTTIGEAKVGQKIYDRTGKLTTILEVSPQGVKPVYKMTLRDGRELFCGLDHNWIVNERAQRKIKGTRKGEVYRREVVKTTRQLIDSGLNRPRIHNGYKDGVTRNITEDKYWVPKNESVDYPHQDLPIDPYIFGIYLGDGSRRNTGITTMDDEIVEKLFDYAESIGMKVRVEEKSNQENKAKTYHITTGYSNGGVKGINPFRTHLQNLGITENKHIPDIYKFSSYEQRLELIRGLLDSDGYCDKNGTIGFGNTNKILFDDFYEVCRSLGINLSRTEGVAKLYGKDCGPVYSSIIYTELPIFKLSRKLNNMRIGVKGKQPKINLTGIVAIEYVFDAETTCIMVDNEGHDFLTDYYTITHNSVFEASYIAHGATFDENSQNVIAGLNAPDIKLITDKIDKGLNHLPEYFKWEKIESNWGKTVTLGVQSKNRQKFVFSQILIRNLDNGNNEEAIAGTKPRKLVIDECAKNFFLKSLQAAIPGFTTPYGWTCSPICSFTGGDCETFADAQELMMNPTPYNFLSIPHEEKENIEHGLFLDATYRLEGKEWSTFAEYIGQPENKELQKIKIQVSNPEKALKITEEIIEQRRLAGDTEAYLKERMYYPIKVEDIFLKSSTNFFNKEAIKHQIQFIQDKGIKGNYVEMVHDGVSIKTKPSNKKPILAFPTPKNADLDAPIVIWEPPVSDSKFALYVAGHDSYQKDGQTIHSDSLGALYIYKRIYSLSGDGFQDMLVASYVARPKDKSYFNEQCRLLIKYYNAYTLAENNELSFIDYMKGKNDAVKYLAPQPAWLKAVTPFSTQNQSFGVSRSSDKVQSFLEELTSNYIDEVIHKNLDQDGSVINEVIGVSRIYDIPLLQELLTYERGKNADRYVAFSLALAQANDLNPVLNPEKKKDKNGMVEAIINNAKNSRTFGKNPNKFTQKRRR